MREEATQRLAAILCADVKGYSRLMAEDEPATLRALDWHRTTADRLIAQWGGRIANTAGDSVVAEFPAMARALRCALDVQDNLAAQNQEVAPDRRILFRIGLHVGEVHTRGDDLLGDGVNIAARIQAITPAGTVCLSEVGHFFAAKIDGILFEEMGVYELKNIPTPIRVWKAQVTAAIERPGIPRIHRRVIFHLARRFQAVCDRVLSVITAREGLLPLQYAVLASLDDAPDVTSQQLALRLGLTADTAARLLECLSARGLLETHCLDGWEDDPVFRLSTDGAAVREELKPAIARAMEAIVAPLTEPERNSLHDLLARVIQANESSGSGPIGLVASSDLG